MLDAARETGASRFSSPPRSACCTSCARPGRAGRDFQAVNDRASCPYMKMIHPAALLPLPRRG
ncbi:hypothetical protein GS421_12690 [Rhodococcus hoagii]|nr:hypothetical protein [Prescottella equi]